MVLIDKHEYLTKEEKRLKEDRERTRYWKRWGPYVAERQWATGEIFPFFFFFSGSFLKILASANVLFNYPVREDYSYVFFIFNVTE